MSSACCVCRSEHEYPRRWCFAGPMTSVKEQATGNYAVAMAARGFVTLAFDYYGTSRGAVPLYTSTPRKRGQSPFSKG